MVQINLRAWREERQIVKKKQFLTHLALAAALAVGLVLASYAYLGWQEGRQADRNAYLMTQTAQLDAQIARIRQLEAKRKRFLARLDVIIGLLLGHTVIVRSIDGLVGVLPDGAIYRSLQRTGNVLLVVGQAESNTDIAVVMRKLNQSRWFGEPDLSQVNAVNGLQEFKLQVPLRGPGVSEEEEEGQ